MKSLKKRGVRKKASLTKVRHEVEYKTIDFFKDKGYAITMLCEVLGVSRSAYYKHKNRIRPEKEKQDELLCSLINRYHSAFDGTLGYRRMTMFSSILGEYIKEHNITHSFSGKGNPYDNACIESFHSVLKKEEANLVKYFDFDTARLAIFEYIESWYNRERIHSSIGYITPQQCEENARKSA